MFSLYGTYCYIFSHIIPNNAKISAQALIEPFNSLCTHLAAPSRRTPGPAAPLAGSSSAVRPGPPPAQHRVAFLTFKSTILSKICFHILSGPSTGGLCQEELADTPPSHLPVRRRLRYRRLIVCRHANSVKPSSNMQK